MPEYLHPGVYIEEIERGPKPVEGVPTSTAAFIGETERGPTKPQLVTSYKDYKRWFGGVFGDAKFMPHAVNGFFENGGKRMYVCRVIDDTATAAEAAFGANFTVRALGPGSWGKRIYTKIEDSSTTGPTIRWCQSASACVSRTTPRRRRRIRSTGSTTRGSRLSLPTPRGLTTW